MMFIQDQIMSGTESEKKKITNQNIFYVLCRMERDFRPMDIQ